MRGKFDRKIRNILIKAKIVTEGDADEAYEQVEKEPKLGYVEYLIGNGRLEEGVYLAAMARETRFPPLEIRKVAVDPQALSALTQELAQYYGVLPLSKVGDLLTVAVSNPFDLPKFDELAVVTNCEIRAVLSSEIAIKEMIQKAYNPMAQEVMDEITGVKEVGKLEVTVTDEEDEPGRVLDIAQLQNMGDSPVTKLVNLMISQSLKEGITDIHIEPFEKILRVRTRLDGALREFLTPPKQMHRDIMTRIKVMAGLNVAERRIPQDGKILIRYEGRQVDIRVSILPMIWGEKAVLRLLDSSKLDTLRIENLGFEPEAEKAFREAIGSSYGLVLVTGPTGSGKSTTLYTALKETLDPEEHVVTVEDPVEYQLEGVTQVMVNTKTGLTFPVALRALLRQDPDVMLVGEIRDQETADIAVKAALTGHLVLSTLHTNDAAGTIDRLIDMGIDRFMVASSLIMASAQRLMRRLCTACRRPMEKLPPEDYLIRVGFKEEELRDLILYDPVGCQQCNNGYKGRFAILEAMPIDSTIRRLIVERKSSQDIKEYANQKGMTTLRRCAILNAIRGRTSLQEVLNMTMGSEF